MMRQLACRAIGAASRTPKSSQMPVSSVLVRTIHGSVPSRKEQDPLPPSIMEKYQLHDPTRWVPLTVGGFGLATATGLYHWDAESQMLGLFVLFVGTVYSQGGHIIGKFFDDTADAILKEHQALEDAQIDAVKLALDAHKRQTAVYEDIKMIFEGQKVLMDEVVDAAGKRLKHEVRANFVRKLETVADAEAAAGASLQGSMVDSATEYVSNAYKSDEGNLTSNALNSALAAIADPSQSKDEVGDIYKAYFAKARKNWEDAHGKEVDLDAATIEAATEAMAAAAKRDGLKSGAYPSKMVFQM
uniref:ATP synthase subunit b n=1 Tax=Aplanochytrium stocchinoi TaxID=215587 RepID=A0A7S3V2W9_9STRA|mmetsp:Transcript_15365/g.19023  ORF Transcript_15365/g.19023 Transcript_15365/m.19023 type:complete len:301 (+) Transcript_15365:193-1095(+)|eukprot:CAMPEP_0204821998 /NCGR_PEP_ID=MMETSP1346-20131115/176_1 /ASSEMBLY_ACC=CAM_ASM_000771 /TAXON_ID=215587 /ORGANISM="Aplanochytrium stocchinoi, Strain GSBS06" /LENGTH=300 /DNA_ID=CAMNT_0051947997 /DNA_START=180 /DNA_END=1082 /DNA_ORIENTATION=+